MSSLIAPVETRPSRSRDLHLELIAGALTLAALWFILCWHLSSEWSLNEQYNYGWFVPFFALFLFWLRWGDRPEVGGHRSADRSQIFAAAVIALAALLLLLPLRIFEIGNPDWRPLGWIHAISVVALTLTLIWYVGRQPWLRHFAFPIAFILVAVPWVSPIEQPIVDGLMRLVASAAAETVSLFGIPAQVQGNLVRLPHGLVGVNEACSGVRSLQTSLMIGLLFGELKRLSILQRVGLVASAVGIALIANFFRALFLVWIAATRNLSEVDRWHDFAGYAIVALVFLGSLALAARLSRNKEGQRSEVRGQQFAIRNPQSAISVLLPNFSFAAALAWLVFVELAAAGWYRAHERDLVVRPNWNVRWDGLNPRPREIKIAEGVRQTLRFDEGREVAWQTSAPEASSTNYLFFFRWNPGGSSVVRARAHRPDICLPSAGWQQLADHGLKNYFTQNNIALPVRHIAFKQPNGNAVAHTFFCLQEDKVHLDEPRPDLALAQAIQPDWSLRGRTRAVKNGVRNLGQQVLEIAIVSAQPTSDESAEEKFAKLVRELIVAAPAK